MKVIKRFFAVFLSVCVAASAFCVPTYAAAEWVVPALVECFKQIFIGYAAGTSAQAILSSNATLSDTERQQILSSVSESTDLIEFVASDDQKTVFVQPVSGLSGEQAEIADFLCDSIQSDLNKSSGAGLSWGNRIYSNITDTTLLPDTPDSKVLKADSYEFIKTSAHKAMNGYVAKEAFKQQLEEDHQTINSIHDLETALGDSFPRYDFDFVGPIPSLTMTTPNVDRISSLNLNGFSFSTPFPYSSAFWSQGLTYNYSKHLLSEFPSFFDFKEDSTGFYLDSKKLSVYGMNQYFVTADGSVYFMNNFYSPTPTSTFYQTNSSWTYNKSYQCHYYDVNGNEYLGYIDDLHPVSTGYCFNVGNQVQSAIPVNVVDKLTDDDFKTSTGGVEIVNGIPRTGIENILGSAIGMGLIAADAPLTIGADGTITKADGIPVDKLGEILDAIQSGNLNLESIEEYLTLISTLVGNGNLTMTEQQKILENVNANTKAGAKDIADIKEALHSLVDSDSLAITAELDFDIKTPSGIIDKFPFCLPFDVYKVFNILSATPRAPSFKIPIEMKNVFSYSIDVNLSEYEDIAVIVRWFLYIIFVLGLILATNKLIGRG